jgi:E3 ubiquitin-protein ligase mind-bomb
MGNTGTITGIDSDNDIEVTYSSGNKWTFNPAVLTKVVNNSHAETTTSIAPSSSQADNSNINNRMLQINDVVQICGDNEKMKRIQKGHGEWAEAMKPVSSLIKVNLNF